jgi:hypothetical protein
MQMNLRKATAHLSLKLMLAHAESVSSSTD